MQDPDAASLGEVLIFLVSWALFCLFHFSVLKNDCNNGVGKCLAVVYCHFSLNYLAYCYPSFSAFFYFGFEVIRNFFCAISSHCFSLNFHKNTLFYFSTKFILFFLSQRSYSKLPERFIWSGILLLIGAFPSQPRLYT